MANYSNVDIMDIILHNNIVGQEIYYYENGVKVSGTVTNFSTDFATRQITLLFSTGDKVTFLMTEKVEIESTNGFVPMPRTGKLKKQK